MSGLISRYSMSQDKYIAAFAAFGEALISDTNVHLVIIPHVIQKGSSNDDEIVCRKLVAKLKDNNRFTLIDQKYNACQIKHVISQCNYFIGARTHSIISGLSSCKPTLSIGYSSKTYGINKEIFGHTAYTIPISDLNERILMEKYLLLCSNHCLIVEQLRQRLPAIKTMAERGGQYLDEMLKKASSMRSRK